MNDEKLPVGVFVDARTVRGDGPSPSRWMFIGEAPGYEEDRSGRPFVGPSGRLLNRLLEYHTDLRRSGVYVTNVVKHRPPSNRRPKAGEVKRYLPYLYDEIRECAPDIIVTLGAIPAKVFDKRIKITHDHGVARRVSLADRDGSLGWSGILVPWLHPAYALRSPAMFEQLSGDAARLGVEVARLGAPSLTTNYELAMEADVVSRLLREWVTFGFDTETTSPEHDGVFATDEATMIGYSVSWAPGTGVYVPTTRIGDGMAGILGSPLWTKVCHNAKFEIKVLRKQGVELVNFEDTKVAAYLIGAPLTGLKVLTKQILGIQPITYEDVTRGGAMSDLDDETVMPYAAADADHTLRLWPLLRDRLASENLVKIYENVEKPLTPVLAAMEAAGMNVNVGTCERVQRELIEHATVARRCIYDSLRDVVLDVNNFNVDSPDQLADVLDKLQAPLRKRTKVKRRLIVDADALRSLYEHNWMPALIEPLLDYRRYLKMYAYTRAFIGLRGPDGRLHTSFNQSGHWEENSDDSKSAPSTGRISSSGPNLHNVPHHRARIGDVDWGRELRSCLVASTGNVLLSADLGQEEPRIIAIVAEDDTLMRGFAAGSDIYRPATEALYPYTQSAISDGDFRRRYDYERFVGKTFFLAWYYGAGASRLRTLDKRLTTGDVKRGLALLDKAHPARAKYLVGTETFLRGYGYVESLYGRKRWVSKVWSGRKSEREEALREAANMRIQSTAADILKMALVRIHNALGLTGLEARLVSTVHDEVVLDLPSREVTAVVDIVRQAFRDLLPGIELTVEARIGETWAGHGEIETGDITSEDFE